MPTSEVTLETIGYIWLKLYFKEKVMAKVKADSYI